MKRNLFQAVTRIAIALLFVVGPAPTSRASVEVAIDAATISEFLGAVMPDRIDLPVAGSTVPVRVRDFKVRGFAPASAGTSIKGYIDTSLTVQSADFGLSLALEPRLSVKIIEHNGFRMCQLRFEEVPISLPLMGEANLAPFFQPVILPADYLSQVPTGIRDVPVRTRLADVTLGRSKMRLHFDLIVNPKIPGLTSGR